MPPPLSARACAPSAAAEISPGEVAQLASCGMASSGRLSPAWRRGLRSAGRPLAGDRTALLEALAAAGEVGIELISALRPGILAPAGRSAGGGRRFCGPLDGAGTLFLLATRCTHRELGIPRCDLLSLQLRPPPALGGRRFQAVARTIQRIRT